MRPVRESHARVRMWYNPAMRKVQVDKGVVLGDGRLTFIAGPCVIESRAQAVGLAKRLTALAERLKVGFVFKASFDKANRTSVDAFRGPGIDRGLEILAEIRAMPGRQGEMRILECHRAYGPWPEKEGWDEVARFAKDCGFTVLDVNVCTGPIAWYPSKVLPVLSNSQSTAFCISKGVCMQICHASSMFSTSMVYWVPIAARRATLRNR